MRTRVTNSEKGVGRFISRENNSVLAVGIGDRGGLGRARGDGESGEFPGEEGWSWRTKRTKRKRKRKRGMEFKEMNGR